MNDDSDLTAWDNTIDGLVGKTQREFLRSLAQKMRDMNRPPSGEMFPTDHYAAEAIYAVIEALEDMARTDQETP